MAWILILVVFDWELSFRPSSKRLLCLPCSLIGILLSYYSALYQSLSFFKVRHGVNDLGVCGYLGSLQVQDFRTDILVNPGYVNQFVPEP